MIQNSKKIILTVITLKILFSCSPLSKENICGTYEFKSKISRGLFVLKDSTFDYSYEVPMNNQSSKGNWSLNNDKLILLSYEAYKNNYLIVKEDLKQENRIIRLVDADNYGISGIEVIINSNKIYTTDEDGKIDLTSIEDKIINKIEVAYFGISGVQNIYETINNYSASYLIKLIPIDYGKKYFDNYILDIKRKKIIFNNQSYKKIR